MSGRQSGNPPRGGNPYAALGTGEGSGTGAAGDKKKEKKKTKKNTNDTSTNTNATNSTTNTKTKTKANNTNTNTNNASVPACVEFALGTCRRPACRYRHIPACSLARCDGACGRVHLRRQQRGSNTSSSNNGPSNNRPSADNGPSASRGANGGSSSYLEALRGGPPAPTGGQKQPDEYRHYALSRLTPYHFEIWVGRLAVLEGERLAARRRIEADRLEGMGRLYAAWVEERPRVEKGRVVREDEALPCCHCGLLQPSAAVWVAHEMGHRMAAQKAALAAATTASAHLLARMRKTYAVELSASLLRTAEEGAHAIRDGIASEEARAWEGRLAAFEAGLAALTPKSFPVQRQEHGERRVLTRQQREERRALLLLYRQGPPSLVIDETMEGDFAQQQLQPQPQEHQQQHQQEQDRQQLADQQQQTLQQQLQQPPPPPPQPQQQEQQQHQHQHQHQQPLGHFQQLQELKDRQGPAVHGRPRDC